MSGIWCTGPGGVQKTYDTDILSPTVGQQSYLNMLWYFFSQIRPGMSDFDKFMTAFAFTVNWMSYPSSEGYAITSNSGVCADYANMLSFLCNLVGVPAIPMASSYFNAALGHEIVWVKLNINGTPQWYASDPTMYDTSLSSDGTTQVSAPSPGTARNAFMNGFTPCVTNILKSTSETQFTGNGADFTYSSFWFIPWSEPYKTNSTIGEANVGNYNLFSDTNYNAPNNFFFVNWENNPPNDSAPHGIPSSTWTSKRRYSKFTFNNGYWYWIASACDEQVGSTTYKQYLLRCKSGRSNKDIEVLNIPQNYQYLLQDKLQDVPLLQQWNNKLIFLSREKKQIVIVPFNQTGIDWTHAQSFNLDQSKDYTYVCDFYIDLDGNLHLLELNSKAQNYPWFNRDQLGWGDKDSGIKVVEHLSNDCTNFLYNYSADGSDLEYGDVLDAYNYFYSLGGVYAIGTSNNEITVNEKNNYYSQLKSVLVKANKSDNSATSYSLIKEMNQCFKDLQNHAFKNNGAPLIKSQLLNSAYYMTTEDFQNYGFTSLNDFMLFDSPEDFYNDASSNSIRYDVYFSNQKPTSAQDFFDHATKIKTDAFLPKITTKEISNPWGYYCVVAYPYNEPNRRVISNIVQLIQQSADDYTVYTSGRLSVINSEDGITYPFNTNYNPKDPNWASKTISLCLDWYTLSNFTNGKWEVIRLDEQGQSHVVQSGTAASYNTNKIIELGSITEENHGLYYIKATTDHGVTLYSNFDLLLTQQDCQNWNASVWVKAVNAVSQFKATQSQQIISNKSNN